MIRQAARFYRTVKGNTSAARSGLRAVDSGGLPGAADIRMCRRRWRREMQEFAVLVRALMVVALAACFAVVEPALARPPSFNCRLATTVDETAICQSDELARLDRQLQGLYDLLQDKLTT